MDNHQLSIQKSSRHSKLTGDFAEALVLYWLSKHGFECARLDHTGIDIIARHSAHEQPFGVSVKSRCRSLGSETVALSVRSKDFELMQRACGAFGCQPWFAFVIDAARMIQAYLMPMEVLKEHAPLRQTSSHLRMTQSARASYATDSRIMSFTMKCDTLRWWQDSAAAGDVDSITDSTM